MHILNRVTANSDKFQIIVLAVDWKKIFKDKNKILIYLISAHEIQACYLTVRNHINKTGAFTTLMVKLTYNLTNTV